MKDIPVSIAVAEELERDIDFGGEIEAGGFFAQVNDQPLALHVRSIFEEFNQSPQSKLYDRFETWMIPHSVALMRRSGLAEPTAVGIEVEYLNEDSTCSVISLIPSFKWKEVGGVGLKTEASGSAGGSLSLAPTGEISGLDSQPDQAKSKTIQGLKFGLSSTGQVWLDISANVATPTIQASGVGSRRCEWRFDRDKEPLFGRDIEAWSVIVLPKRQKEIRLRIRYYFIGRTIFFPTRRESEWVDITCKLQKPEAPATDPKAT